MSNPAFDTVSATAETVAPGSEIKSPTNSVACPIESSMAPAMASGLVIVSNTCSACASVALSACVYGKSCFGGCGMGLIGL